MKLRHIPQFVIRSQHQKSRGRHYQVNTYELLANLLLNFTLLVFHFEADLLLLLTRKHTTIWDVLPRVHVVVDPEVEFSL